MSKYNFKEVMAKVEEIRKILKVELDIQDDIEEACTEYLSKLTGIWSGNFYVKSWPTDDSRNYIEFIETISLNLFKVFESDLEKTEAEVLADRDGYLKEVKRATAEAALIKRKALYEELRREFEGEELSRVPNEH